MSEQKPELNPCPSLEEVKQKRLVVFRFPHEPMKTTSAGKSMPIFPSKMPESNEAYNLPNVSNGHCFLQSNSSNDYGFPQLIGSNDQSLIQSGVSNDQSCLQINISNDQNLLQSNARKDQSLLQSCVTNDKILLQSSVSNDQNLLQSSVSSDQNPLWSTVSSDQNPLWSTVSNGQNPLWSTVNNGQNLLQSSVSKDQNLLQSYARNDQIFPQTNTSISHFLRSDFSSHQYFPKKQTVSYAAEKPHSGGISPDRSLNTAKSTEESLPKKVEEIRLKSSLLNNQSENMYLGLPSGETHDTVHRLSMHHPEQQAVKYEKDEEEVHVSKYPRRQVKDIHEIFSDKMIEEIREALGEQGLQDVLKKVVRDLQRGRSSGYLTGPNKSDTDDEFLIKGSGSFRSSSEESSDVRNTQHLPKKFSRTRAHRSQSPRSRPRIITKDIQQLKEREKEMNLLVRNYDQITAPTNTKHSFSTEQIYKQAFADYPQDAEKQYYGQTIPDHWSHNKQERQDQSFSLDGISNQERHFSFDDSANLPSDIFSSHKSLHDYPSQASRLKIFTELAHGNSISQSNPRYPFVSQNGPYPFQSSWYRSSSTNLPDPDRSSNTQLPPQDYRDSSQVCMFCQSCLHYSPSACFQSNLSSKPFAGFQQSSLSFRPSHATFQQSNLPSDPAQNLEYCLPLKPSTTFQQSNLSFRPSVAIVQKSSLPSSPSVVPFQNSVLYTPDNSQSYLPLKSPVNFQHSNLLYSPSTISLKSFSPLNPPVAFQHTPSPYCNPPAPNTETQLFRNGTPLHLPSPPVAEHSRCYTTQHLNPQPPSSKRTDRPLQSGIVKSQVTKELVIGNQQAKAPHPQLALPAHHLKDGFPDSSHHSHLGHSKICSCLMQLAAMHQPEEDHKIYNVQRYLTSLEMYSEMPDFFEILDTIQSEENHLFENVGSAKPAFTKASTIDADVTQRVKDLDNDLDQLKNLRVVDTEGDKSTTPADFEELSVGVILCPECGFSNKAYVHWCAECGEILFGIELTYLNQKTRHDSTKDKITLRSNAAHEKTFVPGNIHVLKPIENSEAGNNELPESGRGLSTADSPVYLEQTGSRDVDSGRESSDLLKEEDTKLTFINENCEEEREEFVAYRKSQEAGCDCVEHVFEEDANASFLGEVKDPILRQFISTYKKYQQSQQLGHNGGTAFNNLAKPQIVDNRVESSAENVAFVAEQNDASVTNQGFTPRSIQESTSPSYDVVLPSRATQFTLSNKDGTVNEIKDNRSRPSLKLPASQTTKANCRLSADQEMDIKINLQGERSKTKKRKLKVEVMDVEIFGYDEIRKGRHQASGRVLIPSLNLACSSEEADDEEDDDVDGVEDKTSAVHKVLRISPESSGLTELPQTNNRSQPQREHSMNTGKTPQQQPIKAAHATPSKTFCSKSQVPLCHKSLGREVPLNHRSRDTEVPFQLRGRGNARYSANYQRHWARSSTAWSSYNPHELNTSSSLKNSCGQAAHWRGGGQNKSLKQDIHYTENQLGPSGDHVGFAAPGVQRSSSAGYMKRQTVHEPHQRPFSATARFHNGLQVHPPVTPHRGGFSNARQTRYVNTSSKREKNVSVKSRSTLVRTEDLQGSSSLAAEVPPPAENADKKRVDGDNQSPRLLCEQFHRLALEDEDSSVLYAIHQADLHAVTSSAYGKIQEMFHLQIPKGQLPKWQCLPDEIWLTIFKFLSQSDLRNLLLTSRHYNRLASDETLWKYITVKPRYSMTDASLAAIAHHRPLSLAMVKCQGPNLTPEGLHYFFKETQGRLQEMNICGCSQGSLVGTIILKVASEYCQKLTHLDASYCHISDEAFTAISGCAERLESVCLNGFQSMNDSTLLVLLRKHGHSLRTLELYACFSLSASAFLGIGELCTNLRRLCVGSCNKLTDPVMITLSTNLARIEELDLRGCNNLSNDSIQKIVRNCPCIRTLVLANCHQISDTALTEIATYLKKTLRVLDVCGCSGITDSGVVCLTKNCEHLTSLDISSTSCTSISVQNLAESSCKQCMETVRLSFLFGLTETCLLDLIHQCPRLRSVHVFGCSSLKNLAKLQSANTKLTIEGDSYVPRSTL